MAIRCFLDSMLLVLLTLFTFCILKLCCLDSMLLVLLTLFTFCILKLCCLDSMFLVLLTLFTFCILKLCCLDSMLLVLLMLFTFCISHPGIMLPRFHAPRLFTLLPRFQVHCLRFLFSVFAFYILHSVFWNDIASIL